MNIKSQILLVSLFLSFSLSCNDKEYDEFEFSYGNTFETDFCIRFTQNDSVYIRENWSRNNFNEKSAYPKSQTNYTAILTKVQKEKLNKILSDIDFQNFNSTYYENYKDGDQYRIYFKKKEFEKKIYVHSINAPEELDSLAYWIVAVKRKLKLKKTNKNLNFENTVYSKPPPPPLSN